METYIAGAILLSIPLLVVIWRWRGGVMVDLLNPSSAWVRACLWAVIIGQLVVSLDYLLVGEVSLCGTPLLAWSGLIFFLYVWVRGVYLLLKKFRPNERADGSAH